MPARMPGRAAMDAIESRRGLDGPSDTCTCEGSFERGAARRNITTRHGCPWRGLDPEECVTFKREDWFNPRLLFTPISDMLPAEHEQQCYLMSKAVRRPKRQTGRS